jgi:HEAT repeat protein
MKLPKYFNKLSNQDQRKWVAEKLKQVRDEEQQLTKLFSSLITDPNFQVRVDERPDLIGMK